MRYLIEYERDGKTVKTVRKAEDAGQAIQKMCEQYGWGCRERMVDADTRGKEWAKWAADTEGGINYDLTIVAVKKGEE